MSDGVTTPWWRKGVIYQIYPRSFQDSNGDGIGDLNGIRMRLDYIVDILGVDAIWLSPIFLSPMNDFGYDVAGYCEIDPIFGTMQDFKDLLSDAHTRNLRVILDLVPNHSSDQHPWFAESSASRDNPKRDWYVWRDASPDGSPPNNWLSVFGGSAWQWHEPTAQYYLHSFLKEQPDLNWRNAQVEHAVFDVVRFWLAMGVDGFRVDVAHYIMKDPEFKDNPRNFSVQGSEEDLLNRYDSQVHIHDSRHADLHPVYQRLRKVLDDYGSEGRERFALGEIYLDDWPEWVQYYGTRESPEFHMPFNFQPLLADWTAPVLRQLITDLEGTLPEWAWPNYVFGNHDQSRPASRYGEFQARVCAVLLLTLRGTPTIYYGDEIGMVDVVIPHDRRQDPWQKETGGVGRDKCRTPMQWDSNAHAGFAPSEAGPWLPLAEDSPAKNVKLQLEDPTSLLSLYRALLVLRKESPALYGGSLKLLDESEKDCLVYLRQHASEEFLVGANLSSGDRFAQFEGEFAGEAVVSTHAKPSGLISGVGLRLRANEATVFRLNRR